MAADPGRIYDSFESGLNFGRRVKEHSDELAYRMARAKSQDRFQQGELDQRGQTQDLQSAEQGVNPYAGYNSSEAGSRSMADQALGPGTADAAGIGRSSAGALQPGMEDLATRMSTKQTLNNQDIRSQADYRDASAEWMDRRTSGGRDQSLKALQIQLAPLTAKEKAYQKLTPEEQQNKESILSQISDLGGNTYTAPAAAAPTAPAPQGFFGKVGDAIASRIKGGPAAAPANYDPSTRYHVLRTQGMGPDEAKAAVQDEMARFGKR